MTNPILVVQAEAYLREFGVRTRAEAKWALSLTTDYDQLTGEQRAELLDRIEPLPDVEHGNSGPGGPRFPEGSL